VYQQDWYWRAWSRSTALNEIAQVWNILLGCLLLALLYCSHNIFDFDCVVVVQGSQCGP
jgi:hypothetical protein